MVYLFRYFGPVLAIRVLSNINTIVQMQILTRKAIKTTITITTTTTTTATTRKIGHTGQTPLEHGRHRHLTMSLLLRVPLRSDHPST